MKKKGRGEKTTWSQRSAMLDWLELAPGDNFKLISGSAQTNLKSVVELAEWVNTRCLTKWDTEMQVIDSKHI